MKRTTTVYEPGDTFATDSRHGNAKVYRVNRDGEPMIDLVASLAVRSPAVTDTAPPDPAGRDTTQR